MEAMQTIRIYLHKYSSFKDNLSNRFFLFDLLHFQPEKCNGFSKILPFVSSIISSTTFKFWLIYNTYLYPFNKFLKWRRKLFTIIINMDEQ